MPDGQTAFNRKFDRAIPAPNFRMPPSDSSRLKFRMIPPVDTHPIRPTPKWDAVAWSEDGRFDFFGRVFHRPTVVNGDKSGELLDSR
jgi:hypothetical protein